MFRLKKGNISLVIEGKELNRQSLEVRKVLPEQIGIFGQGGAVAGVPLFLIFRVGQVKSLGHQIHELCLVKPPVIKGNKRRIGHLIVSLGEKEIAGRLQLQLRIPFRCLLENQAISRLGLLRLPKLRQPAGDFDRIHNKVTSFQTKAGAGH